MDVSPSKLQELGMNREAYSATVHVVTNSWTQHDWVTELTDWIVFFFFLI